MIPRGDPRPITGPNRITTGGAQSNVNNKANLANNRTTKRDCRVLPQIMSGNLAATGNLWFRSAHLEGVNIQFDSGTSLITIAINMGLAGIFHVASYFLVVFPPAAVGAQGAAAAYVSGTVGVRVMRATIFYAQVVMMENRTTGQALRVRTIGKSFTDIHISHGTSFGESAAAEKLRSNLRNAALRIARHQGSHWGMAGNRIELQRNRTLTWNP